MEKTESIILGFILVAIYLVYKLLKAYKQNPVWSEVRGIVCSVTILLTWVVEYINTTWPSSIATYILYGMGAVMILVAVYMICLALRALKETGQWAAARPHVHIMLYAVATVLFFIIAPLMESTAYVYVWIVFVVIFGLVALWQMIWLTYTKIDYSPFTYWTAGVALAMYIMMFLYAYVEIL